MIEILLLTAIVTAVVGGIYLLWKFAPKGVPLAVLAVCAMLLHARFGSGSPRWLYYSARIGLMLVLMSAVQTIIQDRSRGSRS